MSRLIAIRLAAFLMIVLSALSCSTEIDIIAPQRDLTVIYGLLEVNKSRHFIRINKVFVGEKPASELAAVPGINEYSESEMQARILEKFSDGQVTGREWVLKDTVIYTKEEGDFANEGNKVYYFDANLDPTKRYRIECYVTVSGEDPKTVSAETELVGNWSESLQKLEEVVLERPTLIGASSDPSQADRAEVDFVSNGDYVSNASVVWSSAEGGVAYSCYYRFYYTEEDLSTGARRRDSVEFPIGSVRVGIGNQGSVEFAMRPTEFFNIIDREIEDYNFDNPTFRRIASDTLQYFLEIADNELATYMQVNKPATQVLQEQPEYTNVNNGIGIFASRYIASTRKKERQYESGRVLRATTLEELLYSNAISDPEDSFYTSEKGFVRPSRCNDETKECR